MAGIVNTAGGKTRPKAGRLGSGAYHPVNSPIPGNIFGPNTDIQFTPPKPAGRPFGSPSNAGNSTQFGQNRATTGMGMAHPNAGFHTISQLPKVMGMTRDGNSGEFLSPWEPNPVIQPHERNRLLHRKIFGKYRTASGASRTLPSDTAFQRIPPKQRPPAPRLPQPYTLNLVKSKAVGPSFVTKNNLWFDPNNSFTQGSPNLEGQTGKGRWHTVKKGAAG